MTGVEHLSHVQQHALWVSCMASDVPVPLTDPGAVERVAALVRRPGPNATQPPARYPGAASVLGVYDNTESPIARDSPNPLSEGTQREP